MWVAERVICCCTHVLMRLPWIYKTCSCSSCLGSEVRTDGPDKCRSGGRWEVTCPGPPGHQEQSDVNWFSSHTSHLLITTSPITHV